MKYPFASVGWMAFMHGLIVERVRRFAIEAPDVAWSICEVFTDPPEELSIDGSPLAWHCVMRPRCGWWATAPAATRGSATSTTSSPG